MPNSRQPTRRNSWPRYDPSSGAEGFGFGLRPGRKARGIFSRAASYFAIRLSTSSFETRRRRSVRSRNAWYSFDGLAIGYLSPSSNRPVTISTKDHLEPHGAVSKIWISYQLNIQANRPSIRWWFGFKNCDAFTLSLKVAEGRPPVHNPLELVYGAKLVLFLRES